MELNLFSYQNKTSLFQSDLWAEFHSRLPGYKVYRIESFRIYEAAKTIYISGVTKDQLDNNFSLLISVLKHFKKFKFRNKIIAVDFQISEEDEIVRDLHLILYKLGFNPSALHWIPRQRGLVNLSDSLENVVKSYHNKTWSDIKRAKKKGVQIIEDWDIEKFYTLYLKTAQKHKFNFYSLDYFQTLCEILKNSKKGKLLFASMDGYPMLVAAIICEFNNIVYYLFTGSRPEFNYLNASSVLQHYIIEYSKVQNYFLYDLMGIRNDFKYGPTKFKLKFVSYILKLMNTYIKEL